MMKTEKSGTEILGRFGHESLHCPSFFGPSFFFLFVTVTRRAPPPSAAMRGKSFCGAQI
jgi:hypothetical protein